VKRFFDNLLLMAVLGVGSLILLGLMSGAEGLWMLEGVLGVYGALGLCPALIVMLLLAALPKRRR